MLKWLGYAALLIGGIFIWALSGAIGEHVGRKAAEDYREGRTAGALEEAQAAAAQEIRKQLPMRVDEVTTMQSVASSGGLLMYYYRMDYDERDIDKKAFINQMTDILKKNVCGNSDMADTMRIGARYKYTYISADGAALGNVEINRTACGL